MANPVLHIKDSYYFEVPKLLYPYAYTSRTQFPEVWISLDPEYQDWDAERLLKTLHAIHADLPPAEKVTEDWHHWTHADHANFAKPLKRYLEEKYQGHVTKFKSQLAQSLKRLKRRVRKRPSWTSTGISSSSQRRTTAIRTTFRFCAGDIAMRQRLR